MSVCLVGELTVRCVNFRSYHAKSHTTACCWRIQYKLCLMMRHLHTGRSPSCLADVIEPVSKKSTQHPRSTDSNCYSTPRLKTKFGERAFSFSGPSAWNALPTGIHDEACTATFKKKLKTFYFSQAFEFN